MTTNTYRLAVALQAKAIDSIDLHAERRLHRRAHLRRRHHRRSPLPHRGRPTDPGDVGTRRRRAPLGSAEAAHRPAAAHREPRHRIPQRAPCAGNAGYPHRRRSTATPPSSVRRPPGTPARPRSGSTPTGAPTTTSATTGRPGARHATTWSLLVGTAHTGLIFARTKVDVDTAIGYAADLETRHLAAI